ncbi:hypothetical protein BCR44DRAFT_1427626 [Catenaria anguillulae PL171]|uniref:Uncharacterized protein n=1 Tax=Catenaria anguillulae PL171 TaxID=765915 RepID=A0A1Y2HXS2_9FUNG|nr:hypothetical protein BCR44DRAFT_1427626 [Catenaria anguillulae PL171]
MGSAGCVGTTVGCSVLVHGSSGCFGSFWTGVSSSTGLVGMGSAGWVGTTVGCSVLVHGGSVTTGCSGCLGSF